MEESSEIMNGIHREKMAHDKITGTHCELMEQDIDYKSGTVKPDTQSSSAEVATRRSDGSQGNSSQTVLEHSFDAEGMPFFRHVPSISFTPVRSIVTKDPPRFDSPFPNLRKTGDQSS